MSLSKRAFEAQQPTLAATLQRARSGVETALRAADDGCLDYSTVDTICLSLIDALKHLSAAEDEAAGRAGEPDDADDADCDERNW